MNTVGESDNRITLPVREYISDYEMYGARRVAEGYCGIEYCRVPINGEWQHGWVTNARNFHPEWVLGSDGKTRDKKNKAKFYVARKDQEAYLHACEYTNVRAIGLPLVYVKIPEVMRRHNSLLIMPQHSLVYTRERIPNTEYAQYLNNIIKSFYEVCICISKVDIDKGNWNFDLKHQNLHVVAGADAADANSLYRIASLMSQYEYMTTNSFGSHVVYAAYLGCKVSVCGPQMDIENLHEFPIFKNAPDLLENMRKKIDSGYSSFDYPDLCCEPLDAVQRIEWASIEIGLDNRLIPKELKKQFGWRMHQRIIRKCAIIVTRLNCNIIILAKRVLWRSRHMLGKPPRHDRERVYRDSLGG